MNAEGKRLVIEVKGKGIDSCFPVSVKEKKLFLLARNHLQESGLKESFKSEKHLYIGFQ